MVDGGGGGGVHADVDVAERRLGDLTEDHEQEHPADASIRTLKEVTERNETKRNVTKRSEEERHQV